MSCIFLASLRWLSVCFKMDFKIFLLVLSLLNGLAPAYITEPLTPYVPAQNLRSSGGNLFFTTLFFAIQFYQLIKDKGW